MNDLLERVLRREARACARLLRLLDDGLPEGREILKKLYPHTGRTQIVGITGNPGSGKSTLVDQLIERFRQRGKTVAVVAIDPTSPFSGGAILGDRIRMQRHSTDDGVFIRSFATRGYLGGLTASTVDVVYALDGMGWDVVLVETVGVGQDEVEIQHLAHTTVVVMAPGLGDEIQAIKAGILEIADIFVVNKADREGADRTVHELQMLLDMGHFLPAQAAQHGPENYAGVFSNSRPLTPGWQPRILKTVAARAEGITELMEALDDHRSFHQKARQEPAFERARLRGQLLDILRRTLLARASNYLQENGRLEKLLDQLKNSGTDPYSLAEQIVAGSFANSL